MWAANLKHADGCGRQQATLQAALSPKGLSAPVRARTLSVWDRWIDMDLFLASIGHFS